MASTRPRTIPAAKFRYGVVLSGAVNGANNIFTTPDKFTQQVPGINICVYYNGQRLLLQDDYLISESGGLGTGYDTVTVAFTPSPGDKLWADYVKT